FKNAIAGKPGSYKGLRCWNGLEQVPSQCEKPCCTGAAQARVLLEKQLEQVAAGAATVLLAGQQSPAPASTNTLVNRGARRLARPLQ
ncbi:hypothetical protein, partial [Pseudomonas pergaminensis]